MTGSERHGIFISHATPGDNAYATWLASRLSMSGYDVWCDQEKLLGGEDFWQDIEDEIRNNTVKFVLIISENAFDTEGRLRGGIKNEIALANIIKKQLGDDYFIIPMRIDDTSYSDFSIDFLRLNGIDCGPNWASGFATLLDVLARDEVPRSHEKESSSLSAWRNVHQHHVRAISQESESVQTNWLPIKQLPREIYFYSFRRTLKLNEPRAIASDCSIPCLDHGWFLGSFAEEDELQAALGDALPIKLKTTLKTEDFLNGVTNDIPHIQPHIARNKLTSLVRQAWDGLMKKRGLSYYDMANGQITWWFPDGVPEDGQLRYTDFSGKARRRAVSGTKGKKEGPDGQLIPRYHWHLGFTGRAIFGEQSRIILQPRLIISEDGKKPIENKTRLNSVRRSLTTMWFNDKWRTLVLGFSSWVADQEVEFDLPLSNTHSMLVGAKPILLEAPVSIAADPVSKTLDDEIADKNEQQEYILRLTDPAFLKIQDEEDES